MNWINLSSISQLDELMSANTKFIILKHSTRCSISLMVKKTLEQDWNTDENTPTYYLDLLSYRDVSNYISTALGIPHESPQILLIEGRKCLYDASHSDIEAEDILSKI